MTTDVREPAVAGQFYPESAAELRTAIEKSFRSSRGPGGLRAGPTATRASVTAAVVPHAGYRYSGPIAARAFAELATRPAPSAVVILGVDHHGTGSPFAVSLRDWSTPLGRVKVDRELGEALATGPLTVDEAAHRYEHSIEVELPFLQTIWPGTPIVPIQVRFAPLADLFRVGGQLRRGVEGRDVVVVASSDFSHYVPASVAQELDRHAIAPILAVDPTALYRTVTREEISMCGIAPVTALLAALEGPPRTARLLAWGHSGEAEPMPDVVGYASIVFGERTEPATSRDRASNGGGPDLYPTTRLPPKNRR